MSYVQITPDSDQGTSSEQLPNFELVRLQEQLDRIQEKLLGMVEPAAAETADDAELKTLAKEIVRSRRRREKVFGCGLFGEPAWDILLELYAAERTHQRLSVSGACYVSAAPHSTALRWIRKLESDGWVKRNGDPLDGRRSWVELTEYALTKMRNYLKEVALRTT
jgi:DNA-binding MarR family transcriptional regulator